MGSVVLLTQKEKHRWAISHFCNWRRKHPDAPLDKQIEKFDYYVDKANAA